MAEHHDVPGVDHGYDILDESEDATRPTYALIADHVRRAVAAA